MSECASEFKAKQELDEYTVRMDVEPSTMDSSKERKSSMIRALRVKRKTYCGRKCRRSIYSTCMQPPTYTYLTTCIHRADSAVINSQSADNSAEVGEPLKVVPLTTSAI
jgi:hypothetical protein